MEYLAHHGVKGMKWGVRRYQRKGGSYTQKGLSIYRDRVAKREESKQKYKDAKASGQDTFNAREKYKSDKYKTRLAKQQVRRDYKADKGKALYNRGRTVTGNQTVTSILNTATGLATAGIAYATQKYGTSTLVNGLKKDRKVQAAGAAYLALVGVTAGVNVKAASDNSKIRAYYSHSRPNI